MKRFDDQVAVIIGGARGIGRTIVERLVLEGAQVCILDVLKNELDELIKLNVVQHAFVVDITDEVHLKETIQNIIKLYGRLDIMINSAGIVGPTATKIEHYSLSDFQKILNINLNGAFNVTKAVLPPMVKQNYGRILHITSIGGKEGNPGMVGYTASKAGLMGLVKGVGKEYADTGITVNGLAPAVIATPMNKDTDPEMLKYMTAKIPMGRLGTVEEVAALVCWIVSKEATFNTGFIFDISGGRATY
ncbi:SDR family oxidoreductase [Aurantibacter crassamenti]|uniref:SDR family NAD(P)-dependent oxidoreductase n=1 Tax=Aurantibacter crassamenti TaxID=1837375 RepID=UPI001939746D|nr:SDR family NAD(P)-dependent oxidoreductase [Aurantibacter crassamenti]MBM1105055.1 SDR family oxidoreductase [Aurantibacter crassamenti]